MTHVPSPIVSASDYYPFGLAHGNGDQEDGVEQPYLFNGKEIQNELNLGWLDYGARMYMPELGRWSALDPRAEDYFPISAYTFVTNNPISFVDPNGESVYLFYYIINNYRHGERDEESDRAFMMAALTRALDLLKSGKFGKGDVISIRGVSNLNQLDESVKEDVNRLSNEYGKTQEVGIWSHSGFNGPLAGDSKGEDIQPSLSDWEQIDFNWNEEGAKLGLYGCRSGKDPDNRDGGRTEEMSENSFAQDLSMKKNMSNVEVWGQTERSYPSSKANARSITWGIQFGNHSYPTYFVGSTDDFIKSMASRTGATRASPMAIYKNGLFVGFKFQPGSSEPLIQQGSRRKGKNR